MPFRRKRLRSRAGFRRGRVGRARRRVPRMLHRGRAGTRL